MGFLRTLFWMAVTVVVVVFSFHNWNTVTIDLFGGLAADAKLPVLLFAAFLLGFGPMFVYHKIARWQDRRRTPAASPTPPAPLGPFEPAPIPAATPEPLEPS